MAIGFLRMAKSLDFRLNISFYFEQAFVYTISEKQFSKIFPPSEDLDVDVEPRNSPYGYLIIECSFQLEEFDSVSNGSAICRPRILALLGFVCFLTGKAIIPANFHSITYKIAYKHLDKSKVDTMCVIDEKYDLSADLKALLEYLEKQEKQQKVLIYSLLDRWRKAVYLEVENEEGLLNNDEAILACFHIWEVLGEQFGTTIKTNVRIKYEYVVTSIFTDDLFLKENQIPKEILNVFEQSFKAHISTRPKILLMLSKLNLLNEKSKAIVERFLMHRNAIAHGQRGLYEDRAIYPLKPFFTQINDIYETIETIKIATGRTIAAYIGLNLWKGEWDWLMEVEPTPYEYVQKFLKDKSYQQLSPLSFLAGSVEKVTPGTLVYYFLKRKWDSIIPFEKALKEFIMNVEPDAENAIDLLYIGIILADSADQILGAKCQDMITCLRKGRLIDRSIYRDTLKELEHQGVSFTWYPEFLKGLH